MVSDQNPSTGGISPVLKCITYLCSPLYFLREGVPVERVRDEEIARVVHGERPEPIDRWHLACVEVHHVLMFALVLLDRVGALRGRIHGVLWPVGPEADRSDERALPVRSPVEPGLRREEPAVLELRVACDD